MKYLALLLLVLAGFVACRKEQPKMNTAQNACDCVEEVSADFKIEEAFASIGQFWNRLTETDTILKGRNVYFTPKEQDANYIWYLGNEVITQKTFGRYFDENLLGQNITISLVVKKKPDELCFPNDDGYDSITKTFHVAERMINTGSDFVFPSMEGTYRVKSDHLSDSFEVVVNLSRGPQGEVNLDIENYDGEGSNCINIAYPTAVNYRQIFSELSNGTANSPIWCDYLRGDIHRRIDGITEINFTFYNPDHPDYQKRKYLGRKL